jgi:hypothetical protein
MPFISQAHKESLGDVPYTQLYGYHSPLGYQPETGDKLLVPLKDRYSGTYILGVQGVGKSGLLENLISHDIHRNHAVIVIDPHGDLTRNSIAQLPPDKLSKTYLLDIEDEDYPFGLNIFNAPTRKSSVAQYQAIDRVMHCFDVLWPDVLQQQHLPRFLLASIITLFANPGSTLVDMYALLIDDATRHRMLKNVTDQSVHQFWQMQYDQLSAVDRFTRVRPLLGRLEALFMGRSIVRNIVGQRQTTIDFRKAIENKEIIFIRLPIKTLTQDSRLIGTLLIAQIHQALFSFADMPEDKRPGFSLYVDEFEHFATSDFSEMFTEGRKFGVRLTLAHQYRRQIPEFLRASTLTAGTVVCFKPIIEDAREVSPLFINGESAIDPESIEVNPVDYLLKHGSDIPHVQAFTDFYLRQLQHLSRNAEIEIRDPGFRWEHLSYWALSVKPPEGKPSVANPIHRLNHLLHEVMKTGNSNLAIHPDIVKGFSNCGLGFYGDFRIANKSKLLLADISFPPALVVETANGSRWTRLPENGKEQLYHFLYFLRQTMNYLSLNPIGKKSTLSPVEVSHMLMQLPRRAAFVRSGQDVGVIYTDKTADHCVTGEPGKRYYLIRGQTRAKYCTAKVELDTDTNVGVKNEPPISRWEEVQ